MILPILNIGLASSNNILITAFYILVEEKEKEKEKQIKLNKEKTNYDKNESGDNLSDQNQMKLKASDIYSDDSNSSNSSMKKTNFLDSDSDKYNIRKLIKNIYISIIDIYVL